MFEVGQKIRVKRNARHIRHHHVSFVQEMDRYQGKEAIIKKVSNSPTSGTRVYNLDIAGTFWFVDEWLESVEQIGNASAKEICKILKG